MNKLSPSGRFFPIAMLVLTSLVAFAIYHEPESAMKEYHPVPARQEPKDDRAWVPATFEMYLDDRPEPPCFHPGAQKIRVVPKEDAQKQAADGEWKPADR